MALVQEDASAHEPGKASILVVDDEVLIRFVQAETLREAGYEVIEAASGDEAIQLLQAGVEADLMITDVRMPGTLDGLALARAAHELRPELVIAVSSAHIATIEGGLNGIIAGFLPKPYRPSQLIAMAEKLLESK